MAKITKDELINAITQKTGIVKKTVTDVLNTLLDEITKTLQTGKDVVLTGFGTFSLSRRKARTGRNPKTGEIVNIPAKSAPRFKAGKSLKDAVK